MNEEEITSEQWALIGRLASDKAINNTFRSGGAVTYLCGNRILKHHADSTIEVLKTVDRPYVKVKQMKYKL